MFIGNCNDCVTVVGKIIGVVLYTFSWEYAGGIKIPGCQGMNIGLLQNLFWSWIDLLFPPRCGNCDSYLEEAESGLCTSCLAQVSFLRAPLCDTCGQGFLGGSRDGHLCSNCLRDPPPYSLARSLVHYGPVSADLLKRLKYHSDLTVAAAIRGIISKAEMSPFTGCDLVLPVPLSRQRLQQRGFNQALFLARLSFAGKGIPIAPAILVKKKDTASQAGLKRQARQHNLRGSFGIRRHAAITSRRVCLVDDIFTTGATVAECSRTLLAGGAAEVLVLTFARTRR
jgi:ComF family protein